MPLKNPEQNWQNYRTLINGKIASCTVNLDIFEAFSPQKYNKVVQVSLPYEPDENAMPTLDEHHRVITELFKILIQVSALSDVLYAGHIIGDGHLQLHFYCDKPTALFDVLDQFKEHIDHTGVQDDPNWDTYFDFLLPSPLEMKLNVTEEILGMLLQNGRNLADNYLIEHTFQFADEQLMYQFMEETNLSDIYFNTMSYSNAPIIFSASDEEDKESFYIVKIEQEMSLDTDEIFAYVEQFERLAEKFSGEYVGWESDTINQVKAN
ncbi:TIGR01619 family protein [Aggregatibacter actinomycetemcomitans]|uniref:TIGR01619 family protein n=1 Tax=Aggregatibacter actinomycetemcomitans TaxID=714 RepID=UPI001E2F4385|nr:TIGR01619 family protein [Aggregatibacter actinomycetemcomitans]